MSCNIRSVMIYTLIADVKYPLYKATSPTGIFASKFCPDGSTVAPRCVKRVGHKDAPKATKPMT